ncbi:MAG TPA: menaquinone biosynthesis protein, partial [Planctomycetaceae bacterium]|nr:menaquinone biosynthesis protein [Planctomycetaceae bacterium]
AHFSGLGNIKPHASRPNLRIGAVNYLNSKPLIEGLAALAPHAELMLDYPSRLAQDLSSGRLDVALVPSIACLLAPHYEVVSDACVAARGAVLSVKLYSRVPPKAIRRLALDEGSRTSATLVRILLAERHGVFPQVEPLPLDSSVESTDADAVLLIGDRAIHPPREQFECTWDLGTEWTLWTGLPFVFAMWGTRTGTDLGDVDDALRAARDVGVSRLPDIARREAPLLGLSEQVALDYLTRNLYYRLGAAERQGLRRFQELAVKHDLAPGGFELVFRDYAAA